MPRGRREKTGSSVQKDPVYSSDDFRMYCFKVMPCSRHYSHDWTECPFAHPGEKATRRDPRLHTYVGIECPNVKNESSGGCPRGDSCPFAHNVFECWMHPSRYRTQMCNEPATCKRKICFFAHNPEELRAPGAVSKEPEMANQAPKRISTSRERTSNAGIKTSPPPVGQDFRRQSCDGRLGSTQRGVPSGDLPPRPRMSLDSTNRITRHQSPPVIPAPQPQLQQQQFTQGNTTQSAILDQLNTIAAINQQQNFNSLDLVSALERVSLNGAAPPTLMQTAPIQTPGLDTNGLQSQQLNALLITLLQMQDPNSRTGLLANAGSAGLTPNLAALLQADSANLMNRTGASVVNPSFPIPDSRTALNNPYLLQQLQMAQNLGALSPGFRSSVDSTLSNNSGNRIPMRVSYDAMTSNPGTFQQLPDLNNLPIPPQNNLSESASAPEFFMPGNQARSSTESSYTESFGPWSMDASILDALKPTEGAGVHRKDDLSKEQNPVDDFIAFNQGRDTFARANADPKRINASFPTSTPSANPENWN